MNLTDASGCSGLSAGTVFKFTTNGAFTKVFSFNHTNGAHPQCGPLLATDGALYGSTTSNSGASGEAYGTIFRLTPNGALTTAHRFDYRIDGSVHSGNLLQARDGNYYGTAGYGITNNLGTIFKMTPGGVLTTLVNLNGTNGGYPHDDLVEMNDGYIYGRTTTGGKYDNGTLFRLTTNGVLTTILNFDGTNGTGPWAALVVGGDGNPLWDNCEWWVRRRQGRVPTGASSVSYGVQLLQFFFQSGMDFVHKRRLPVGNNYASNRAGLESNSARNHGHW